MTSRSVEIKNRIGLHAGSAAFFVHEACNFQSTIWLEKGDRRVSAKSLLGILSMGIAHGETVTLVAAGDDEGDALADLADLLENKLVD